ncbi:hypothetical protein GN958_ATG02972, partial [Phytophthora infestans]
KLDAIASHVAAVNTEGKPCVWVLDSEKVAKLMLWVFWLVGELATAKACVVAVNAEAGEPGAIELHVAGIPEANCFWFERWLLVNKLLEDVALASVDNESSNLPVHVSLVASAIWRKRYFCKKVSILGNTLLSNISIR